MEQLERDVREHTDADGIAHIDAAADAACNIEALDDALVHIHGGKQRVDGGVDRALGADEVVDVDLVQGDLAAGGGFLRRGEDVAAAAVAVVGDALALADEDALGIQDPGVEQLGDRIDDAAAAQADGLLARLADDAERRLHRLGIDDAGLDRAVRCAHAAGDVAALEVLIALIMIGGIKRIGRVTEKLIPFMAVLYIILAIGVVLVNINNVPAVFKSIFQGAFSPASVTGGAVGSFFMSMKKGVSRGIFSNEAGLGTGSIAHACADTSKPVKQGFFGIFEVFVDTIVICTLTALVILCSGVPVGYGQAAGAELTISGFTSTYGGWVSIFTAVAMCCFAFSTVIGWGLYGQRCIEFLFGPKATKPFMAAYSLVAVVGATMNLGLMWSIAETFNGLMVIPNLIAVFLLSNTVVQLLKDYFNGEGKIK